MHGQQKTDTYSSVGVDIYIYIYIHYISGVIKLKVYISGLFVDFFSICVSTVQVSGYFFGRFKCQRLEERYISGWMQLTYCFIFTPTFGHDRI